MANDYERCTALVKEYEEVKRYIDAPQFASMARSIVAQFQRSSSMSEKQEKALRNIVSHAQRNADKVGADDEDQREDNALEDWARNEAED